MQAQIPHFITPEAYLEGEEISSVKHEYLQRPNLRDGGRHQRSRDFVF